jgi:hypothetical protein
VVAVVPGVVALTGVSSGAQFVPLNPSFESGPSGVVATPTADKWSLSTFDETPGIAEILASAEMSGAYVCHLRALGQYLQDDSMNWYWSLSGALLQYGTATEWPRATIDGTNGKLAFDVRAKATPAGSLRVHLTVLDGAGANLVDMTAGWARSDLMVMGLAPGGSAIDDTTIKIAAPTVNTTYPVTLDIKGWISAPGRLLAGKSWSDVATVGLTFYAESGGGALIDVYLDNFRAG